MNKLLALCLSLACVSCRNQSHPQTSDAGVLANAPTPTSATGYQATLYARALDVSCAPPEAQPGVEGCIALIRYQGGLSGIDVPTSAGDSYGNIAFVRTDATGKTT